MNYAINDIVACPGGVKPSAGHNTIQSAADAMRKMLDSAKGGDFHLKVDSPEGLLVAHWHPFGYGTGVIEWQDGKLCPAITLACSGHDPVADSVTIEDYVSTYGPPKEIVTELRKMKRPFLSTIYYTHRAMTELQICGTAIGFGQAFFTPLTELGNRINRLP
jgi:hypothetical protein